MSEDRCICCGEIVPEGRMVCPNCLAKLNDAPTILKPYKPNPHPDDALDALIYGLRIRKPEIKSVDGEELLREAERLSKYESPIKLTVSDIVNEMEKTEEEMIFKAVENVGVSVDKEGLIRAIEADRGVQEGRLVEVTRCGECRWYSKEQGVCFHTLSAFFSTPEDFYCAYGKRREKTDEV